MGRDLQGPRSWSSQTGRKVCSGGHEGEVQQAQLVLLAKAFPAPLCSQRLSVHGASLFTAPWRCQHDVGLLLGPLCPFPPKAWKAGCDPISWLGFQTPESGPGMPGPRACA